MLTIAKILVDKWFYVYSIPARIHSDQGRCFDNQIMQHLYALYGIEQSTTTPSNPCGNAQCEWFNHTMICLLTLLLKEQKDNWQLHLTIFGLSIQCHSTQYNRIPALWANVWLQNTHHLQGMAQADRL